MVSAQITVQPPAAPSSGPQFPPKTPAILEGKIQNKAGEPVIAAHVSYERLVTPLAETKAPARGQLLTGLKGSFRLADLAAGSYQFCVRVPGSHYLDPCEWSAAPLVNLAPGEIHTHFVITLETGVPLHIRLDDPDGLLPDPDKPALQRTADTAIFHMAVWGKEGLPHVPTLLGRDAGGQNHLLVVPREKDLRVIMAGRNLDIADAEGKVTGIEKQRTDVRARTDEKEKVLRYRMQRKLKQPGPVQQ